jgi:hypothetical protein
MDPEANPKHRDLMEDHLVRVLQTEQFGKHYQEHYPQKPAQLYERIENSAHGRTLFDYFNRTSPRGLSEEIMIPRVIEAQCLLGYWNNGKFTQWHQAATQAAQERLENVGRHLLQRSAWHSPAPCRSIYLRPIQRLSFEESTKIDERADNRGYVE